MFDNVPAQALVDAGIVLAFAREDDYFGFLDLLLRPRAGVSESLCSSSAGRISLSCCSIWRSYAHAMRAM